MDEGCELENTAAYRIAPICLLSELLTTCKQERQIQIAVHELARYALVVEVSGAMLMILLDAESFIEVIRTLTPA